MNYIFRYKLPVSKQEVVTSSWYCNIISLTLWFLFFPPPLYQACSQIPLDDIIVFWGVTAKQTAAPCEASRSNPQQSLSWANRPAKEKWAKYTPQSPPHPIISAPLCLWKLGYIILGVHISIMPLKSPTSYNTWGGGGGGSVYVCVCWGGTEK